MTMVSVDVPEALLEHMSEVIMERKARLQKETPKSYISQAQRAEAVKLANTKGLHVANAYLKELRPAGYAMSRSALVLEFIKQGLDQLKKEPA